MNHRIMNHRITNPRIMNRKDRERFLKIFSPKANIKMSKNRSGESVRKREIGSIEPACVISMPFNAVGNPSKHFFLSGNCVVSAVHHNYKSRFF